jgi:limonene-1,2-epoxide hydrolase
MGVEQEAVVRAFLAEFETDPSDAALFVERVLSHMAPDAHYQIFAWDEPFVGHDAIRAELLRQAPLLRDVRVEIVTIGSIGQIVFTERVDSMLLRGKPITSHIAGVFEVGADGKIAAWREYLDSRELSVQLGQTQATRGSGD